MREIYLSNKYFINTSLFIFSIGLLMFGIEGKELSFFAINHQRSDFLDFIMPYITFIGDGWFAVFAILLCSFAPLKIQIQLLITWFITFILVITIKHTVFVDFNRPVSYFYDHPEKVIFVKNMVIHSSQSFPSGHTASAFAVLGSLAFLFNSRYIKIILALVAALVGISRVYLGQHFFEDILVGCMLGLVSLILVPLFCKKIPIKKSLISYILKK